VELRPDDPDVRSLRDQLDTAAASSRSGPVR
jgi:hypothetical protein